MPPEIKGSSYPTGSCSRPATVSDRPVSSATAEPRYVYAGRSERWQPPSDKTGKVAACKS
jgi:hypothetical protein